MNVWLAETRKDLRIFFGDPASVAIGFVLVPVVLAFFVGFAIQGLVVSTSRYRLPVIDLDHTKQSRQIVDALRGDADLDISVTEADAFTPAEAGALLGGGKRIAVLVIPKGLAEAPRSAEQFELPAYVDPTQGTRSGLVLFAVQRALYRLAAPDAAVGIVARAYHVQDTQVASAVRVAVASSIAHPPITVSAQPSSRGRGLPNGFDQSVPGIALMGVITYFSYTVATASDERRIYRTWSRAMLTPASHFARVLGKFTASYVMVAFQIAAIFVLGPLVFGMDVGDWRALTLVLAAFAAFPTALGVFLALLDVNRALATIIALIGTYVIGAVSGAFVPVYLLPSWLQPVALVSPLYWAISAAQDVMIRGAGIGDVLGPVLALLAISGGLVAASVVKFQRAHA